MTDLWPDFNVKEQDTENSIKMLKNQASILGKKTNGLVKATFSKIVYSNPVTKAAAGLAKFTAELEYGREIIEDELEGKKDGNLLFQKNSYKFEIYNDTYRFRVFTLECNPIYPITIRADEGICNEINIDADQIIENETDLTDIITSIFASDKLSYIVRSMIRMQ